MAKVQLPTTLSIHGTQNETLTLLTSDNIDERFESRTCDEYKLRKASYGKGQQSLTLAELFVFFVVLTSSYNIDRRQEPSSMMIEARFWT
jgi:hypothetical protein